MPATAARTHNQNISNSRVDIRFNRNITDSKSIKGRPATAAVQQQSRRQEQYLQQQGRYTDKKGKEKEIHSGAVAKSYMRRAS
jgi:hypothetical protein